MSLPFEKRKADYAALWASAVIRPERMPEVRATARRILASRPRYDEVSRRTGVPWFVIGIIHNLESSLDFSKHLHNGDRLMRDGKPAKTVRVPAGRGPFATWEDSAVDALTMPGKEYHKIRDWTVERIADVLERYNGMGYRRFGIASPYLWSFTSAYSRGKYVADGVWSASAVSQQCGGMAILRALIELEPTQIDLHGAPKAPEQQPAEGWAKTPDIAPPTIPTEAAKSKSVWAIFGSAMAWLATTSQDAVDWLSGRAMDAVGLLTNVQQDVEGGIAPIQALGGMIGRNVAAITTTLALVLMVVAIARHVRDKRELNTLRQMLPKPSGD